MIIRDPFQLDPKSAVPVRSSEPPRHGAPLPPLPSAPFHRPWPGRQPGGSPGREGPTGLGKLFRCDGSGVCGPKKGYKVAKLPWVPQEVVMEVLRASLRATRQRGKEKVLESVQLSSNRRFEASGWGDHARRQSSKQHSPTTSLLELHITHAWGTKHESSSRLSQLSPTRELHAGRVRSRTLLGGLGQTLLGLPTLLCGPSDTGWSQLRQAWLYAREATAARAPRLGLIVRGAVAAVLCSSKLTQCGAKCVEEAVEPSTCMYWKSRVTPLVSNEADRGKIPRLQTHDAA